MYPVWEDEKSFDREHNHLITKGKSNMSETPYSHHGGNIGRARTVHPAKTVREQETLLPKPGLTIVAFIRPVDHYQLLRASDLTLEARGSFQCFKPEALHWTITGVLAREQPDLNYKQREDIEKAVKDVMREELASMPQFVIAVQGVELGNVHSPDGTVVAVANPGSRRFVGMIGARLREKLKPRLKAIHPDLDFGPERHIESLPKHRVKATLGYFKETKDFRVNQELALALEELSYVEAEIRIESIALVRFRYKSLEDATKLLDPENASNPLGESGIVDEIQLRLPTDKPFRQTTAKPKLLVAPRWVDWRGYSWLFDNPGSSLIRHAETGLQQVACEPWVDPELGLYRALGDVLAEAGLDSATNHYTFFNLPSASYHVTALDGVNEENLSLLSEQEREKHANFLLQLPGSAKGRPPDSIPKDAFNGVIGSDPIQFRFAGLSIWGDSVLVARLAPVGEASARILERVCERRKQLDEQFAPLGRPKSSGYNVHCSLGYFLTPQGACAAAANLPQWESLFRRRTAGHHLAFRSISAYAFTSMETFFRIEKGETDD